MRKFIFFAMIALLSGCTSIISGNVLKGVDRGLTLELVQANPNAFKGKRVLWGGLIVSTTNLENVTEIEVLETALAYNDVPTDGKSRGRFIVSVNGYLDAAVYKEGQGLTVAGSIKGVSVRKIGKMDYAYPVVTPIELKVSEPYTEDYNYNYPYGYGSYYGPYYGGSYYGGSPYYYGPYSPYYPYGGYGGYGFYGHGTHGHGY